MNTAMIDATIKQLRTSRGLTQAELARQLDVTQQAVARWEKAITSPDYETLNKLASIFGVSTDYLLGHTPPPLPPMPPIDSKKIPLIGTIACGRPILAQENHESYVVAVDGLNADFALRIKGESMAGDGLHDGYIVFIRQCDDVDDGEMAAVLVGDEATIKRIYRTKDTVTLVSSNPAFAPLVYHSSDGLQMRVIGKPEGFQGRL
jgi:repressor LexA